MLMDIVYYGLGLIACWWFSWYFIALITGFHLRSISINNGVLFNGLSFCSSKIVINLKSLRFRLWGNTRMIILDDLNITLLNDDDTVNKKHEKSKMKNKSKSRKPTELSELEDLNSTKISVLPGNRLAKVLLRFILKHIPKIDIEVRNTSITSSAKFKTRIDYAKFTILSRYSKRHDDVIKFYSNIVTTNVQIRNTATVMEHLPPSSLGTFRFQLNYSIHMCRGDLQNIQLKIFTSDVKVSVFNTFKYLIKKLGKENDGLGLQQDQDGATDEDEDDIDIDNLNFPRSDSFRYDIPAESSKSPPSTSESLKENNDSKFQKRLNRIVKLHNKIYSAINEISIHVENTSFLEIPFATTEDNQTFTEYFKQSHPRTSVSLNIKSMSVNLQKLYEGSAGFEVLFDPKVDKPFHATTSFQLLKLDYSKLVYDEIKKTHFAESDEVLNIPNYSFTFKSNIMDNLANGYGFKNCVVEFFSSASSPILDVDTAQLSSLLYNLILLKKFLKLNDLKRENRKLARRLEKIDLNDNDESYLAYSHTGADSHNQSVFNNQQKEIKQEQRNILLNNYNESDTSYSSQDADDMDETKIELDYENSSPNKKNFEAGSSVNGSSAKSSPLKNKFFKLLNDYYPRLDVKLIIEQPRLIIRNNDKLHERIQILNFSYSLLNVHVMTTAARDYDAKCHILHPCTTYHEKSDIESANYTNEIIKKEILSLRSAHFQFDILKNLRVKSLIDIDELMVDLGELDVLVGINRLFMDVTTMTDRDMNTGLINLFLNSEIIKQRSVYPLFHPMLASPGLLSSPASEADLKATSLESKLFKVLPHWLVEAELRVSHSHVHIGSRSVLIGKDYISQVFGNGFDKDFGSSNHNLRAVKFTFDDFKAKIKNDTRKLSLDITSSTAHSSTDSLIPPSMATSQDTLTSNLLSENNSDILFWAFNIEVNKINISVRNDLITEKFENFLSVPNFNIEVGAVIQNSQKKLRIDGNVGELRGSYDRYKFMTIIGSIYLIKEIFVNPFKSITRKFKNDMKRFSSQKTISNRHLQPKKLKDFLHGEVKVVKSDLILHLSDDFKIKLQLFNLINVFSHGVLRVDNRFARILADSPTIEGYWSRLACIDGLKIDINDPDLSHKIAVDSESIRLIQPHSFVVHQLFDNLSISIKTMKHLVHAMKGNNELKVNVVKPKESKTVKVPKMKITSNRLSFCMEDDPFESELSVIYQLGIVEQRKRLEQISLFEERAANELNEHNEVDLEDKYETLLKTFSTQWVRKIRLYKDRLNDEIVSNRKFLFGNEASLARSENTKIVAYMSQAPLLSVIMDGFDLDLQTTKFDLRDLPQFIYDMGQGVPKSTKYSLMFPSYIQLTLTELRMHLRDYPLPLLHLPPDSHEKALNLEGHLVISEALIKKAEHLRKLYIPLTKHMKNIEKDKHYSLTIEKSLSTVKLYTDIQVKFGSKLPSRFVWGQSYQFGIQQVMLNFDQFSKPPVDPSMKLGFWDKLRLIMHGKFKIITGPSNGLEVAFKGSRDPYDLFDSSSGFVLAFSDNVEWKVNENDDSRLFFDIKSDKISWYIPNYLISPLLSWTRESSKFVYLPNTKRFVSSCFAYYLDDTSSDSIDPIEVQSDLVEKQVLNLHGGVNFKVGFILQRSVSPNSDEVTDECKPHYEINLYNPDFTGKDHDSYAGFRSDKLHMAISLSANTESSYNAIHLSPGVFKQFFSWWKLFSGNMMLPIRRGVMFGELKKSMKFSQHLFTNKFQFRFKSLFISHLYRDETIDSEQDSIECVGVRAKMDDFIVDLHQRKEPRIEVHEGLSRNKKIMKMNFNVGEVHLSGIDLRLVHAVFDQDIYSVKKAKNESNSHYNNFDNDDQWFDILDYEEAYLPSLNSNPRKVDIYPLMYSKRFSYLRDTETNKSEQTNTQLGSESTHDCLLKSTDVYTPQIELFNDRIEQLREQIKENRTKNYSNKNLNNRIASLKGDIDECRQQKRRFINRSEFHTDTSNAESKENFHNKFVLISMFLKWNVNNRNFLLKYIHFVQLKSSFKKYLSYESISTLEELIHRNENRFTSDDLSAITSGFNKIKLNSSTKESTKTKETSKDRFNGFDEIIRRVKDNEKINEDFMIEIISPQIQLQSEDAPDSVVLIAAPGIDAKIISVVDKKTNSLVINGQELEKRYGFMLKDANIFVIEKNDTKHSNNLILNKSSYGTKTNWPPWLGIEICKNGVLAGKDKLLVEKSSLMVTYDQIKPMASKLSQIDEGGSNDQDSEDKQEPEPPQSEGISNRLRVDMPNFIISSTSKQYFTLYIIVTSLLFYSEPMSKSLSEKLEKLKFSIDFQDLRALHANLTSSHKYYQLMNILSNNYNFRQSKLDNESLNDYLMLNIERGNVVTDIYLMMQSILNGDIYQAGNGAQPKAEWILKADQIILHMLEDDRTPILDIAIAHGRYTRTIKEDNSNDNKLQIEMMQGFNLLPNAHYQGFLEPLEAPKFESNDQNLINVDWSMKRSIGGIKIMENFQVNSQPLNIKIDEITGEKLMNFIFRTELESINESPLLNKLKDIETQSDDAVGESDYDDSSAGDTQSQGFVEQLDGTNKNVKFDQNASHTNPRRKSNRDVSKMSNHALSISGSSDSQGVIDNDIEEMIHRSKSYLSIVSLKANSFSLLLSIKCNKGYRRALNVENLKIKLPELSIENEILSVLEVTMMMKKLIIKTLLSHTGRLLRNKMSVKRKLGKNFINKPLKPVKKYVKFTQVSELAEEGLTVMSEP